MAHKTGAIFLSLSAIIHNFAVAGKPVYTVITGKERFPSFCRSPFPAMPPPSAGERKGRSSAPAFQTGRKAGAFIGVLARIVVAKAAGVW